MAPPSTGETGTAAVAPVRLRAPGIGVDAPVVPVGVTGEGEMEIPERISDVGWYRFSPAPGAAEGSTVLAGHVDDRVQGDGAFSRLSDLGAGDPITVDSASGTRAFRVVSVATIPKGVVPLDSIFAQDGPPRLVLITCGGAFDRASRNYVDNVVVQAEPIASS